MTFYNKIFSHGLETQLTWLQLEKKAKIHQFYKGIVAMVTCQHENT